MEKMGRNKLRGLSGHGWDYYNAVIFLQFIKAKSTFQ